MPVFAPATIREASMSTVLIDWPELLKRVHDVDALANGGEATPNNHSAALTLR
jgi:hypothetical protein